MHTQLAALEQQVERLLDERSRPPARAYYYLGAGRALSYLSDGTPMYVYTEDRSISPWIIGGGVWETFVDDIMMDLCEPGMKVCDIGANQGYYTLKFAARVGTEGRVTSLEPNPSMFALLRDSVELNGFGDRVRLHNAAAGGEAGELRMTFDPRYPGGGHLFETAGSDNHKQLDVRVVKLDDVFSPDETLDLIKVDVEGWEPHVFRGMQATLARNSSSVIVTELSWEQWSKAGSPPEILAKLAGPDRSIFLIHNDATLERVDCQDYSLLNKAGTAYALLLPWTAKSQQRLGARLRR